MNETVCKFFNSLAGCKNGEDCEFRHTKLDPSEIKLCKYFKRDPNGCLYGDNCMLRHESPEQPIVSATETLQTDDNMHTHSTLTNLDEEESATSGNDCTIKDDFYQEFFECEYCSFKIEISYPDEDDSALFVKHFKEKHIDILQGNEIILQYLTDSTRKSSGMKVSNNFEKEFPDLETAANVKGKKVEKKQNPKTSSPNENKNLVNVRYPGGEMNLEHHRFPEFFSGGRKELLYVIVSSYVSSFLSQKEQILCIMKELALTEQDYCESLETVNKYLKKENIFCIGNTFLHYQKIRKGCWIFAMTIENLMKDVKNLKVMNVCCVCQHYCQCLRSVLSTISAFASALRRYVDNKNVEESIENVMKLIYWGMQFQNTLKILWCDLLQDSHNLDLHYLFQDEARDSLKILLSAIKNELKSKCSTQAFTVPLGLTIVTGKGNRSKDKQPILITSVQNTLRREGYNWSIDKDGAYLIYFKI